MSGKVVVIQKLLKEKLDTNISYVHSEKQSIKKNMGDVLCFLGKFVAAKFQL